MALAYAMTQVNLEEDSMNVMAGTRMVKEYQAVQMSSNAVRARASSAGCAHAKAGTAGAHGEMLESFV